MFEKLKSRSPFSLSNNGLETKFFVSLWLCAFMEWFDDGSKAV